MTALLEDGHQSRTYRVSGPESLLPADQMRVLGEVLGRNLQFEPQSDDEARAEMTSSMPIEYAPGSPGLEDASRRWSG